MKTFDLLKYGYLLVKLIDLESEYKKYAKTYIQLFSGDKDIFEYFIEQSNANNKITNKNFELTLNNTYDPSVIQKLYEAIKDCENEILLEKRRIELEGYDHEISTDNFKIARLHRKIRDIKEEIKYYTKTHPQNNEFQEELKQANNIFEYQLSNKAVKYFKEKINNLKSMENEIDKCVSKLNILMPRINKNYNFNLHQSAPSYKDEAHYLHRNSKEFIKEFYKQNYNCSETSKNVQTEDLALQER